MCTKDKKRSRPVGCCEDDDQKHNNKRFVHELLQSLRLNEEESDPSNNSGRICGVSPDEYDSVGYETQSGDEPLEHGEELAEQQSNVARDEKKEKRFLAQSVLPGKLGKHCRVVDVAVDELIRKYRRNSLRPVVDSSGDGYDAGIPESIGPHPMTGIKLQRCTTDVNRNINGNAAQISLPLIVYKEENTKNLASTVGLSGGVSSSCSAVESDGAMDFGEVSGARAGNCKAGDLSHTDWPIEEVDDEQLSGAVVNGVGDDIAHIDPTVDTGTSHGSTSWYALNGYRDRNTDSTKSTSSSSIGSMESVTSGVPAPLRVIGDPDPPCPDPQSTDGPGCWGHGQTRGGNVSFLSIQSDLDMTEMTNSCGQQQSAPPPTPAAPRLPPQQHQPAHSRHGQLYIHHNFNS